MMVTGAIGLAIVILGVVLALLLKRQLREKYAIIWLVIGLAVLLLGIFPQALLFITASLGFQVPANLLFTLAIFLLLAVSLHLSWELSQGEEEIRRLAEEAAIGRLERETHARRIAELEHAIDELRTQGRRQSD
nr:DUF2304 domain-containing protein [Microbacterium hydrocarbonoxydans]